MFAQKKIEVIEKNLIFDRKHLAEMESLEAENIEFDLSHGRIAAKWWGSKAIRPILMVHGWQDSAGYC